MMQTRTYMRKIYVVTHVPYTVLPIGGPYAYAAYLEAQKLKAEQDAVRATYTWAAKRAYAMSLIEGQNTPLVFSPLEKEEIRVKAIRDARYSIKGSRPSLPITAQTKSILEPTRGLIAQIKATLSRLWNAKI